MKRIIIVDDEYLVRLGLKTTIDWAEHGYLIVGEASNGKEALELFERTGADVIVTDIKMPVMDGLELTKAVKEKNKKVQILILSHYDEFAYAQEALKLGAFRYILKSELTKTNLINTLKALFYASSIPDTEKVPENTFDESLEEKRRYYQERYIEQALFPLLGEPKIEELSLPLPETVLFPGEACIILSGSCRTTALVFDAKKLFPKTIKTLITEAYSGSGTFGDYRNEHFKFISIIPVFSNPGDLGAAVQNRIAGHAALIVKNIRQYYDAKLLMGLSSPGKLEDLARLLGESQRALSRCFFSEKDFVTRYTPDLLEVPGKPPHISYTKLAEMIDLNQKEVMLEYIRQIFQELRRLKNYMQVHEAFIDFLSIGKSLCEKYKLQEQASLSESKFNYDTFYDIGFIGDVEFYIYGIFLAILMGKQDGKIGYSFIVKKCIVFIHQQYTQNITLSEAARYVEVSHSYLSFIFKQETGINFNTYLSHYRVEEAKKLLKSTNMRIYEIAEKIGFSNPYYFSKVFKEFTGMSCKNFRDAGA